MRQRLSFLLPLQTETIALNLHRNFTNRCCFYGNSLSHFYPTQALNLLFDFLKVENEAVSTLHQPVLWPSAHDGARLEPGATNQGNLHLFSLNSPFWRWRESVQMLE